MKSRNIEELRKEFKHEWLLIAVEKVDQGTTTPLAGQLLAHSPSRDEIYKQASTHKGNLMTVYSDDWPEDIAAAFQYAYF